MVMVWKKIYEKGFGEIFKFLDPYNMHKSN